MLDRDFEARRDSLVKTDEQWAQEQLGAIERALRDLPRCRTINFAFGSHELTPRRRRLLDVLSAGRHVKLEDVAHEPAVVVCSRS